VGRARPKALVPLSRGVAARRRLKRVFAIDMAHCPVCQQSQRRIIAAITERRVIQTILRHVKLAVAPPPIAPAQQAAFAWAFSSP
jgi:hypothetical protein